MLTACSSYDRVIPCSSTQSIPVDSCVLGEGDSLFLQQASHLTKGIYGRVPLHNQHALLQYLMVRDYSTHTRHATFAAGASVCAGRRLASFGSRFMC